jgi:hypothetical protein
LIRDAVLHLLNEQPLLVDLPEMPTAADVSLICTNVRTTAGKRPAFVDHSESRFVFPYVQIRFVELPHATLAAPAGTDEAEGAAQPAPVEADDGEDAELDEDFLRRIREA